MKTSIRIEGGAQLAAALNQLSVRASKQVLRDALREAGEPLRRGIASAAPRDPGAPDLADHIVLSTGRADSGPSAAVVIGPSTAVRADQPKRRYDQQGRYLEDGTSRHTARPFMRPVFDQMAVRLIDPIKRAIWAALVAKGIGSARGGHSTTEAFAGPRRPTVMGGPGGSTL